MHRPRAVAGFLQADRSFRFAVPRAPALHRGEPSPGADVVGVGQLLVQTWQGRALPGRQSPATCACRCTVSVRPSGSSSPRALHWRVRQHGVQKSPPLADARPACAPRALIRTAAISASGLHSSWATQRGAVQARSSRVRHPAARPDDRGGDRSELVGSPATSAPGLGPTPAA